MGRDRGVGVDGRRHVLFVTGGARSGKSRYAQGRVEAWPDPLLYVATAEVRDAEMADRVEKHRADRGPRWTTREEPMALPGVLADAGAYGGVLVDCLTLWVSNLLEAHGDDSGAVDAAVTDLVTVLHRFSGRVCLVTNEVGSGIVPAHPLARRYRDLAGTVNQRIAAAADEAVFVVAGLPLYLKGGEQGKLRL